jgi:hypothetical protein
MDSVADVPVLRHLNRWTVVALGVLIVVGLTFGITLAVRSGAETPESAAAASYRELTESVTSTSVEVSTRLQTLSAFIDESTRMVDDLSAATSGSAPGADAAAVATMLARCDAFRAELESSADALPDDRAFRTPILPADATLSEIADAVELVSSERLLIEDDLQTVKSLASTVRIARGDLAAAASAYGGSLPGTAHAIVAIAPVDLTQDWRDSLVASATAAAAETASLNSATIGAASGTFSQYGATIAAFNGEVARIAAEAAAEAEGSSGGDAAEPEGESAAPQDPAPVEPPAPEPEPSLEPELPPIPIPDPAPDGT